MTVPDTCAPAGATSLSASGRRLDHRAGPPRAGSARAAAHSMSRRNPRRSGCAGCHRPLPACRSGRPCLREDGHLIGHAQRLALIVGHEDKGDPSRCCSAFNSSCIASRSFRSSAPSGSSSSSTRGSFTRARARATRCRCPPDKLAGLAVAVAVELDQRQHLVGLAHRALTGPRPSPSARRPRCRARSCAEKGHSPERQYSRCAGSAARAPTSSPKIRTVPPVGFSKPEIRRRQVVLPEPEGPSMAKNDAFGDGQIHPINRSHRHRNGARRSGTRRQRSWKHRHFPGKPAAKEAAPGTCPGPCGRLAQRPPITPM